MTIVRAKHRRAERLRNVVDCLPHETRVAMLAGLERYDRIIVGAYTDRKGGVCPMLAAHRCGGRTDFRSFARAWDRFTGAGSRARRASERELRTLQVHLEASLWRDEELRASVMATGGEQFAPPSAGAAAPPARRRRFSGSWLLPFRRWDGYTDAVEQALRQAEAEQPEAAPADSLRH